MLTMWIVEDPLLAWRVYAALAFSGVLSLTALALALFGGDVVTAIVNRP